MDTTVSAALLAAMGDMLRRLRIPAAEVTGYTECSYNLGYCSTCAEVVTNVRVYFRTANGMAAGYWDYQGDLGQLVRALTDDPTNQADWLASATRETEDDWSTHVEYHSVDEALAAGDR